MENSGFFDLSGKKAIVTGAANGIGRAISIALAKSGVAVMLADMADTQETESAILDFKGRCIPFKVDITKEDQTRAMAAAALERFGRIDILVNVAGVIRRGPIEECSIDDWQFMLDVNLVGGFLTVKAVVPAMKSQGSGKIINIASTGGEGGFRNAIAYCSSKGGVISMTKSMAIELAPFKINVNAISPNVVLTEMVMDRLSIDSERQESLRRIPLGRFLEPEDIVGGVIYLASPAADMVTGHILHIDGGFLAK